MKIDAHLVQQIATLARIELTSEETELFTTQLETILDYIEQLQEVEGPAEPFLLQDPAGSLLRDDAVTSTSGTEHALKNAPDHAKGLFRVPKVLP
jgi:aspartyl-tRNA(Asn)/glutamyl-tRNA(Gln) amidotransferase subunit C